MLCLFGEIILNLVDMGTHNPSFLEVKSLITHILRTQNLHFFYFGVSKKVTCVDI